MRTLIALPCLDMVNTDFFIDFTNLERVGSVACGVTKSSLVYDARNALAKQAIDGGFDRVLWLDTDISFKPDLMIRLSEHLDNGMDYISAVYFKRQMPTAPVIYKTIEQTKDNTVLETRAAIYSDYPKDQVFEIAGSGFGAVMMTVDILKKVKDKYGMPFSPALGLGEDLSFCWRLQNLGIPRYCDSSIKIEHIGTMRFNEDVYMAQELNKK